MTVENTSPRKTWFRLGLLISFIGIVIGAYLTFGDLLALEHLAQKETELRTFHEAHPILVFGIAFLLYVVLTGASLPGAAALTLVFGWYFGVLQGALLVSFASTAGATTAFLLSRYFFRSAIQNRFENRLRSFNEALKRDGAMYLFTLRLIPAVPFFVINLVMGLTPIRWTTFWWVSQIGMLPGTLVYIYAGSTMPNLHVLSQKGAAGILSPQLIVAFIILGLFPFLIRRIMGRRVKDVFEE